MPKAPTWDDTKRLEYVFLVLKHINLPEIDYKPIAKAFGKGGANEAQKRFKRCAEAAGFKLVNRQIVGEEDDEPEDDSNTEPPAKRVKMSNAIAKTANTKKPAAKKSAQKPPFKRQSKSTSRPIEAVKVREILEISDDQETGTVKGEDVEGKKEEEEGRDGTNGNTDADDDSLNIDEDGDRFRRSRARSATLKAEQLT